MQYLKAIFLLACCYFLWEPIVVAQPCSTLGQNPSTAFPVCGTSVFTQTTVPICGNHTVPVNCPSLGIPYEDKNPFWYKFTCFTSGTLGFILTPKNLGDDYDWQLFDVTGRNPNDVFTDINLVISSNWSGETGITGSSSSGVSLFECGGLGIPLFSTMADLVQGHDYLLLISHFSGSNQSGYTLEFRGGTASITDPVPPNLDKATPECSGQEIQITLNKKVSCKSLSTDGSEFKLSTNLVNISSVEGLGCTTGFDIESLVVKLSAPLPPGNYDITIQDGSDGNTLLDNCGKAIPAGQKLGFTIDPVLAATLDSLKGSTCAPQTLNVYFSHPLDCNSVSPDASDFQLTGPTPVSIKSAATACGSDNQGIITLNLAEPLVVGGTYTLQLVKGNDGNVIVDQCGVETGIDKTVSIQVYDTVSAAFTYELAVGCKTDEIRVTHPGGIHIDSWRWYLNGVPGSTGTQSSWTVPATGDYFVGLRVANQGCADSSVTSFSLHDLIKADFETDNNVCPKDGAIIHNLSEGPVEDYLWSWGNGNTSASADPGPLLFPQNGANTDYQISLVVSKDNGACSDTLSKTVHVLASCNIDIPTAFTPNGDGLNDYLYPLNAVKAENLTFRVYDRWGKMVFETHDWTVKWDGSYKGTPQPSGVFAWTLDYIFADTQKRYSRHGTTMLIR